MCVATDKKQGYSPDNNDLILDAGKVPLDKGKPWGRGMYSDVKNTVLGHWVGGMINFNQKTVAVSLLLFISVVAPTLTFGAVYGRVTGNLLGAVECILATAWVNIAYSFIGGMPTVRILTSVDNCLFVGIEECVLTVSPLFYV